ncbi:MAG TPA: hypothetical protein VIL85_02085 [Thermomicrobiales bacterium]|jgi:uncharacterized protein (DUF433 family)
MQLRTDYLGVGFYSYTDAARIIGIPPAKLRRWVRDYVYYIRALRSNQRPLVVRRFDPQDHVLSFLELIELLFVSLFRQEGLSLRVIREAAEIASLWFSTDYPFAIKQFNTDGQHIFATLADEADSSEIMAELGKGQLAFPMVIEPFLRKIDYRADNLAQAFWPLGRQERVVIDPERSFGKPIDAEMGVPTSTLYSAFRAEGPDSISRVARWYEVPVAAVEGAITFERALRAA